MKKPISIPISRWSHGDDLSPSESHKNARWTTSVLASFARVSVCLVKRQVLIKRTRQITWLSLFKVIASRQDSKSMTLESLSKRIKTGWKSVFSKWLKYFDAMTAVSLVISYMDTASFFLFFRLKTPLKSFYYSTDSTSYRFKGTISILIIKKDRPTRL